MPLSDTTCRTSKKREKPYKLSDSGGLYLLVEKSGSKLWRHAYRFDGKQKLVALGSYPAVSLADARTEREANKSMLAKGIDPSAQRKIDRGAARIARANTFRIVADELIEKFVYTNVKRSSALERYKELRTILLKPEEAHTLLPTTIQAASAMNALDPTGHLSEGLTYADRGAEVLGLTQDPERYKAYLNSFIKAQ